MTSPSDHPTRTVDFHELLDSRGIDVPTEADIEEIAEEYRVDLTGAPYIGERIAILGDRVYEIEA
jgi:hypothetical protein